MSSKRKVFVAKSGGLDASVDELLRRTAHRLVWCSLAITPLGIVLWVIGSAYFESERDRLDSLAQSSATPATIVLTGGDSHAIRVFVPGRMESLHEDFDISVIEEGEPVEFDWYALEPSEIADTHEAVLEYGAETFSHRLGLDDASLRIDVLDAEGVSIPANVSVDTYRAFGAGPIPVVAQGLGVLFCFIGGVLLLVALASALLVRRSPARGT